MSEVGEERQTAPLPNRRASTTSQDETNEENARYENATIKGAYKPTMTEGGEKDMDIENLQTVLGIIHPPHKPSQTASNRPI
ncbi:hypothetical protein PM082_004333 [Marasmius tenuissimus]|nr:hypothetical protein PM082_004333 [Marasmius tenuissimus]